MFSISIADGHVNVFFGTKSDEGETPDCHLHGLCKACFQELHSLNMEC